MLDIFTIAELGCPPPVLRVSAPCIRRLAHFLRRGRPAQGLGVHCRL